MRYVLVILATFTLSLVGCTLRIGGPSQLSDSPAPTTIPLRRTAEALSLPEIVPPPSPIALPPGFGISLYADGIRSPRMLAIGPGGGGVSPPPRAPPAGRAPSASRPAR